MHSDAFDSKRLLIVGSPLENRVGSHLRRAAEALGIDAQVVDLRTAYSPSRLENWAYRVFRDNRMPRMAAFSRVLLAAARRFRPHWCLVTGIAPIDAQTLQRVRALGARTLNFSTDELLPMTQDLEPVQLCAWTISIWRRKTFMESFEKEGHAVFSGKIGLYPIDPLKALKISYESEFKLAEELLRARHNSG